MRRCRDCGELKPRDQFSGGYCRPCHNARNRESVRRNGGARRYHLSQRYGIEPWQVDDLVQQQGGVCAICRKRSATQVDHDHETGKVRGVLCLKCNAGLGALKDSVRNLYHAIEYLDPLDLDKYVYWKES